MLFLLLLLFSSFFFSFDFNAGQGSYGPVVAAWHVDYETYTIFFLNACFIVSFSRTVIMVIIITIIIIAMVHIHSVPTSRLPYGPIQ